MPRVVPARCPDHDGRDVLRDEPIAGYCPDAMGMDRQCRPADPVSACAFAVAHHTGQGGAHGSGPAWHRRDPVDDDLCHRRRPTGICALRFLVADVNDLVAGDRAGTGGHDRALRGFLGVARKIHVRRRAVTADRQPGVVRTFPRPQAGLSAYAGDGSVPADPPTDLRFLRVDPVDRSHVDTRPTCGSNHVHGLLSDRATVQGGPLPANLRPGL